MRERRQYLRLVFAAMLISIMLAACGDDRSSGGVEEDRRFATDPEPAPTELPATHTPEPTSTSQVVVPVMPGASPEAPSLLDSSRISNVYSLFDGSVIVLDIRTGVSRVIARSNEPGSIEMIAPSLDGDTVAVVTDRTGENRLFDLDFIRADGTVIASATDISAALGPHVGKNRGSLAADWDENGQRLAIAFPDGGGVVVDLEGRSAVLLTRAQAPAPLEIVWSPDGEAIAFTSRDLDDDSPFLAIGGVRVFPIDPVRIAGTGGNRPIHAVRWQPDGDSLLAVQGSGNQPDSQAGDLIEVDRGTLSVRFAVGGSRFGPGHAIVLAEPAPEGNAWGIVTVSPNPRGGLQATVWRAGPTLVDIVRLDLGENPPVAGVTWTVNGLTVTLFDGNNVKLATFGQDGEPIELATPSASPVSAFGDPPIIATGSPEASPMASPED